MLNGPPVSALVGPLDRNHSKPEEFPPQRVFARHDLAVIAGRTFAENRLARVPVQVDPLQQRAAARKLASVRRCGRKSRADAACFDPD